MIIHKAMQRYICPECTEEINLGDDFVYGRGAENVHVHCQQKVMREEQSKVTPLRRGR
jgi:hypothetical protein